MLSSHLAVSIDEIGALETRKYFTLFLRKKLITVGAFVEVIFLLLK